MRLILSILSVMIAAGIRLSAQELNCTVEINSDRISGYEQVFESLHEANNEYMNKNRIT